MSLAQNLLRAAALTHFKLQSKGDLVPGDGVRALAAALPRCRLLNWRHIVLPSSQILDRAIDLRWPEVAGTVSIKVRGQTGTEIFFKIKRRSTLKKLMDVYVQRQQTTLSAFRFIFDGNRIRNPETETPYDLEMENGDVIDAMLEQVGFVDFGGWQGSVGRQFLLDANCVARLEDSQEIARSLGGSLSAAPECFEDDTLIDAEGCARLISVLEHKRSKMHASPVDLQVELTRAELRATIGSDTLATLCARFHEPFDRIKLRRVQALRAPADKGQHANDETAAPIMCIGFHLDRTSVRTMQIPLNDEASYAGGRLLFATGRGMLRPRRSAGSATIHDNTIAHGGTQMTRGGRYGLFLIRSNRNVVAD